jgi:hypothetical protein
VLVQKTIATTPASQAIPHLIVAGFLAGSRCGPNPLLDRA